MNEEIEKFEKLMLGVNDCSRGKAEMNQPKFKFGDRVRSLENGKIYTVRRVEDIASPGHYYYTDETRQGDREHKLELYQEPQKKKLFAYRGKGRTDFLFDLVDDDYLHGGHNRAPDYDITYDLEGRN